MNGIKATKRRTQLLALTVLLSVLFSGCTTFDNFKAAFITTEIESEDVVRIGVFEPRSGPYEEQGELEIRGIELAKELFPTALGKPVELIYADNKSDVTYAEAAASELVDKRVAVALGSYGSLISLAAADVFNEAEIPAIAITSTNPLITSTDYYFRVCFVDAFQGNAAGKYVLEYLNYDSAAILMEAGNDYYLALAQMFSDKLNSVREEGAEDAIVMTLEYEKGETQFSSYLQQLQAADVPVIYVLGSAEDGMNIIQQARNLNIWTTMIGTNSWETEEFLELHGATFTTMYQSDTAMTEMSEIFLEAYHDKYGAEETPDSAVALGFDAYLLAINAINEAGTALNGEAIRENLAKTREYMGATGSITLSASGDPIKSVAVTTVEDGKFVHNFIANPSWGN